MDYIEIIDELFDDTDVLLKKKLESIKAKVLELFTVKNKKLNAIFRELEKKPLNIEEDNEY
jgi:hypothetical protein